jgi:hypothetical protein
MFLSTLWKRSPRSRPTGRDRMPGRPGMVVSKAAPSADPASSTMRPAGPSTSLAAALWNRLPAADTARAAKVRRQGREVR